MIKTKLINARKAREFTHDAISISEKRERRHYDL